MSEKQKANCYRKEFDDIKNGTDPAIDKVIEILDENRFDKVDVGRVEIGQSSVEIPECFPVFFSHFLVVIRDVL
jgi:hypothetical protein